MPLFTWSDPISCGEVPPAVCDVIPQALSVKALRGSDISSNCERDLTSQEFPAFPVVLGDNLTEPRSGSAAFPLPISAVQQYNGTTVPSLAFRNAAGQFVIWNPPNECDNKKLVVKNGDFTYMPDVNSNVFDEFCVGSIADVEFIAGGKTATDCNGQKKVQLVFFPKEQFCDICS